MNISEFLCAKLSFTQDELRVYISTCPYRYKKYKIPKKSRRGWREIAQPSKDLKIVQRMVIREILDKNFDIHETAMAYKAGASILKNAKPHLQNKYLLKLDFIDFFNSINGGDFGKFLTQRNIVDKEDIDSTNILTKIFFMNASGNLVLSVGSPGSPLISNAIMHDFDSNISKKANDMNISYTRYSDDLTFSTNEKDILFSVPNIVEAELEGLEFPTIKINQSKTIFSSKAHNRHVTGVTISNDGRATIGRKGMRSIKTQIFLLETGKLNDDEIDSLRGRLAYSKHIDPDFFRRLRSKYPRGLKLLGLS